ncbi:MAG: sigma-70 family RNA polymerase sigma factor [Plectolyngbya sp. WJT66-NPBG17]|nr:sigma-70 family RNA polymerase sigma factor [Plectolyngbya sp. WJT66-NPBG17]
MISVHLLIPPTIRWRTDMPEHSDYSPENRDDDIVRFDDQFTSPFEEMDEWSKFNVHFVKLLNPKSPSGLALFAFLRRILRQFHLETAYSEAYLLNEAYLRAHRLIQSNGVAILNPAAWLRKVAFNIVQELNRAQLATDPFDETADSIAPSTIPNTTLKRELEVLKKAVQRLDPEEQKLLNLKIVEEQSWRSIRLYLVADGFHFTEPALRKKKERALRKLREIYHALKPLSDLES